MCTFNIMSIFKEINPEPDPPPLLLGRTKMVETIDKLVDIDKLQYTCTHLPCLEKNCKIYRWNWGAKRGQNVQLHWY